MTDANVAKTDEALTVRPDGDVVASTVPQLREVLRGSLAGGAREIILDFGNVRLLDSAGIGLLIAAYNSARKTGGRLRVTHASKDILALLRTMRIHQHMQVTEA